ncbi:MAG: hypothetical protein H7Z43_01170, partial [Clostridia bacterium]|nr:hypothetical protein [Deltaproteobacteria bacterium]
MACNVDEFCTGTACAPTDFRSLCDSTDFRTVHRETKQVDNQVDDPSIDNDAADSLAQAFRTFCGAQAPVSFVSAEADIIAPGGRLATVRGTTLIVAGGRVYSAVIDYLDNEDVTPVELVVTGNDTFQLVARSQR